jgi:flagellar M-ring protein FliF
MEPLQKQLTDLPKKLGAASRGTKVALGGAVLLLAGLVAAMQFLGAAGEYQYAFSNLGAEDSAEIAAKLKSAGVPFRLEAGGAALAVPASKVYDVRLLLAADGLPRAGGNGFELFDKGDIGVSEFTRKVNLRRATEGELARTVGRIAGVRSARVHLVLAEKGVFRNDDRPASAAVMVNLRPGTALNERELAGIRHLVASAVPGLPPQAVTVVDGRGAVLTADEEYGAQVQDYQRKLERDFERRVVSLLEPVVGAGQVVARVTANVDAAEVTTTDDTFDPEGSVLKSERTVSQSQSQDSQKRTAVVGAAGNQPVQPPAQPGTQTKSTSNNSEETRNYELSRTTTRTVVKSPRLTRLSVAVVVDGVDGKPRDDAEVQRLGELVRRAVGYDEQRGDQLEIRSAVFTRSADEAAEAAAAAAALSGLPGWALPAAIGVGVLLLGLIAFLALRRGQPEEQAVVLRPGARVAELELPALNAMLDAKAAGAAALPAADAKALPDGVDAVRARARELAKTDPARAASLIRAWLSVETNAGR